ncbi:hypothetical protein [Streptomyces roseolilacinus]|uniref:hypothetical protein n=1 Tax=Streptomyces roseolilacinus TaxID=66904 RepID=UPI001677E11F|nr:hypothetical protein [Streptomyces roseolilacinus]
MRPNESKFNYYNGIFGFDLRGCTRTDDSERFFATRWFIFNLLPLIPLQRYYLSETRVSSQQYTGQIEHVFANSVYKVHGRSRLHVGEIVRTYAYAWLVAPALVIVPVVHLMETTDRADDSTDIWLIIGALLWPFIGIFLVVLLPEVFRKFQRSPRPVSWRAEPPDH